MEVRQQTLKIDRKGRPIFYIFFLSLTFLSLTPYPDPEPMDEASPEGSAKEEINSKDEISDWEARLELAKVLSYLKRYNESIQEFQKLLQERPDSVEVRLEMAKVLFYSGKTEEALTEFLQIPPQAIDDKTWIEIGDAYRKIKNYRQAQYIYEQYLNRHPQDDEVRLRLAELLSWEKRYEESVHQYRILLSHRPDDIQLRRRYAQVLTWMGDDEEAAKEWRKTL